MEYTVFLTQDAATDLDDMYVYICNHDSPARANHVLDEIEKTFGNLSAFPERGTYPAELLSLGITDYREVCFKPYRILYRVNERKVYVVLIADGRRNLQTLLLRRLIG